MGEMYKATCNRCGTLFEVWDGGGMRFEMFHCDRCGTHRSVPHDELDALKKKLRRKKYLRALQSYDDCPCGGSFSSDARSRCPKCRSDEWTPISDQMDILFYD